MNKRILAAATAAAVIAAGAGTAFATAGSTVSPSASDFTAVAPVRVMDTRVGLGAPKAPVAAHGTAVLTVAGVDSVPADATAVTLNLTATQGTANGVVTVYPDGTTRPGTSNLNYGGNENVANLVTVPLVDGKVDFYNNSAGSVDLLADLQGWYAATAAPETVTQTLAGVASVATGGSFNSRATEVGTVDLPAGSYLVTLSAKATPIVQGDTSVQVFPSVHLYNQPKNADFAGDVLDTGGSALESGAVTNADLFSSDSGVVTLTAATTMIVYAFGYDSDSGEGTYQLDSVTVTATPVNVAAN